MIIKYPIYIYKNENNSTVVSINKPSDETIEYTTQVRLYTSDPDNYVLTNGTSFTSAIDTPLEYEHLWIELLKADLTTEVITLTEVRQDVNAIEKTTKALGVNITDTESAIVELCEMILALQDQVMMLQMQLDGTLGN